MLMTKIQTMQKMNNNKLEIRNYNIELRADTDNRTIHGLAIPVESRSSLLGDFYEIIRSSAVNDELIQNNDVKIYLDHNPSSGTYARSKYGQGSLDLSITERGLEFEFEAPNTVFGNALIEGINRGDFDAVSFGFFVGKDEWEDNMDGTYTRSILSFAGLEEISILSQTPAYPQTDVATRSLDEYKNEMKAEETRKQEILNKLDNIMTSIDEAIPYKNI